MKMMGGKFECYNLQIPHLLTDKLQTLKLDGSLLSNINKVRQLKILVIWNVMPCH